MAQTGVDMWYRAFKKKIIVVIILITRYHNIDREFVKRTYIMAAIYRTISCTNACLARAVLAYRSSGVCV